MKFVYDDCTVRQAADHMVNHNIGRLPVVLRNEPTRLIGIVTRSDILSDLSPADQTRRNPTPGDSRLASVEENSTHPDASVPLN